MKVSYIIAASVALGSLNAHAFQSRITQDSTLSSAQVRNVEDRISSEFYSVKHADSQLSPLGTCAATPVPGCNCPFCTKLRAVK